MFFQIPNNQNIVIVAKTPASARKAQSYAERLRVGIAVIHGEAQDYEGDQDMVDGRNSPPPHDNMMDPQPSTSRSHGEPAYHVIPGMCAAV